MRVIYGLAGKIYYIDEQEKECYYLRQLTELSQDIYVYLADVYKLEVQESRAVRNLTEIILPVIAEEMKLSKELQRIVSFYLRSNGKDMQNSKV